jgi:hypothetical protein
MVQSKATSVEAYLAELPQDRRETLQAVREVILENLDNEFEEGMQYGMIGYYVPHSVYPPGYHCDPRQPLPFTCLGAQKNHMALYMMSLYGDPNQLKWFETEWRKSGKKLDMGKACLRFKKIEDLALGVIGATIRQVTARKYAEHCERALSARQKAPAKKAAAARKAGTAPGGTKAKKAAPKKSRRTVKR